ncbi:unnamed protein product [Peniophora sp. CBMAI 1063]|nr:unnamed protein product [Peniophora sp. CBMAI 1063]
MSSGEEGPYESEQASGPTRKRTRRRIQRSCDVCRRKKIKCDWALSRDNKCTFCKTHNFECQHTHGVREEKLDPATEEVESLESLVKSMALWISERHPDVNPTKEFSMPSSLAQWFNERHDRPLGTTLKRLSGDLARINLMADDQQKDEDDLNEEGDGGDYKLSELQTRFQSMSMIEHFLGKGSVLGRSSGLALIQHALELKQNPNAQKIGHNRSIPSRRKDLWDSNQFLWLKSSYDARIFNLPPGDLMQTLVNGYFTSHEPSILLFHEPTFRHNMNMGLHFRDPACAAIILLICALMSRYSDDPRVLSSGSGSWYSVGYTWYLQAKDYYTPSKSAPSLHDVQLYTLMTVYLDGSSSPQTAWTACGTALRLAMDVGAHRKKAYQKVPTVEDELWKRAFWILVILDRQVSAHLGRSCCVQDEDIDLELPLEVDDEYWEHADATQAFKQPHGRPSRVSFLVALVKLMKISGVATRTIFSANPRANILLEALGKGWEQKIVTALDSALNEWVSHVPDHLRWDPRPTDTVFLFQSGILHTQFYQLQIIIHRAYIPTPTKPPQTTFPSLAICTNAARTSCQIISHCRKNIPCFRNNRNAFQSATFQPALVLIFAIWNARRNGYQIDITRDMGYIWECMDTLRGAEDRFVIAGKLWDILYELVSMGDLPLSPALTPPDLTQLPESNADGALGHSLFPIPAETGSTYNMPQMAPAIGNTLDLGDLSRAPGSLGSADATGMSSFAPISSHGSGVSAPSVDTIGGFDTPAMDDLMAAFGFGALVTAESAHYEGTTIHGAADGTLDPSLSANVSDWDSWFPSLAQSSTQDVTTSYTANGPQYHGPQHASSTYNPLDDLF